MTFEDFIETNDSDENKRKGSTIQFIPNDLENENNIKNQLKINNNNITDITFEKIISEDISEDFFGFTKSNEEFASGIMIGGGDVNQFGILKQLTNANLLKNNDLSNNINVTVTLKRKSIFVQDLSTEKREFLYF
jgi:hypothetical protein